MTRSDKYLYNVLAFLMQRHHVDSAYRILDPLAWYVYSGRASIAFLDALYEADPDRIARVLERRGSTDDAVRRVKKAINYSDNTI